MPAANRSTVLLGSSRSSQAPSPIAATDEEAGVVWGVPGE